MKQPTLIIWDVATGQATVSIAGNLRVNAVAFSPDGTRLASGQGDGTLKLWDVESAQNVWSVQGHTSAVVGVAFSPDGRHVATASRDGFAKVWDATTGNELLSLVGDGLPLSGVAFSPDGRQLSTAGDFGIRIYDLAIDDLLRLARSRLTRTWRPEECKSLLHVDRCPE